MAILKKVSVKPLKAANEIIGTEKDEGLQYAVVYKGKAVIALFDSEFWAKRFINSTAIGELVIREVA